MKRCLLLGIMLPVVSGQTPPPPDPLDGLVADSPFLQPAGGARKDAPGATGPLELRGIVFERGVYSFSLYDQASHEAVWVRLGEGGHPFVARSFNRERDVLTVDYQGRPVVLTLQPARMASANPAGAPPAPPPLPGAAEAAGRAGQQNAAPSGASNGNSPPAANANPAAAPANPAEAQRLQNLADELRRRRGTGPQSVEPRKNPP